MLLIATGFSQLQTGSANINFQVIDFMTAEPLSGASIQLSGTSSINKTTNGVGNVTFSIPFGSYTITVSKSACSQIGPQYFVVDQTAPLRIIAKLRCPVSGAPPSVNPFVDTDRSQYRYGDLLNWVGKGFAPGAYVRPCLDSICGSTIQSDSEGNSVNTILIDQTFSLGTHVLTVLDVATNASAQMQITISP